MDGRYKLIIGYKYHCPNVATRLLCKVFIVSMFIRIAMHFWGSYQRVLPIIVSVFDNKETTHSLTLLLEEEAIHNHPLL
jgi:hypothetical protein